MRDMTPEAQELALTYIERSDPGAKFNMESYLNILITLLRNEELKTAPVEQN